jgi:hypothetical protein
MSYLQPTTWRMGIIMFLAREAADNPAFRGLRARGQFRLTMFGGEHRRSTYVINWLGKK